MKWFQAPQLQPRSVAEHCVRNLPTELRNRLSRQLRLVILGASLSRQSARSLVGDVRYLSVCGLRKRLRAIVHKGAGLNDVVASVCSQSTMRKLVGLHAARRCHCGHRTPRATSLIKTSRGVAKTGPSSGRGRNSRRQSVNAWV